MLEKNEKKLYFDAHFHYFDCVNKQSFDILDNWYGCSCAHSIEEWNIQEKAEKSITQSFGIHPQFVNNNLDKNFMLDFLENLIKQKRICCVGEAGFDFYTDEYKKFSELQEIIFNEQLELCIKYNLPMVIHCRKANEKLFEYSAKIKKLPAVLFHSFMGTPGEALSLIRRDINGMFSFGKQIMNGNKKTVSCVIELPLENLLLETDAPFQFLIGENKTVTSDIIKIYSEAINLRNIQHSEDFYLQIKKNYSNMFNKY